MVLTDKKQGPCNPQLNDNCDGFFSPTFSIRSGDLLHALTLLNNVIFVLVLIAQKNGLVDVLSPSFVEDGFCISNKDKSVWV